MSRLVIQSTVTGRFLAPGLEFPHSPDWFVSLRDAGILFDYENACSMIEEYAENDDHCIIVDLDRLGTLNYYPIST